MNITFRQATIEDAEMIRNWIKTNEFARHWYFLDKIPRLLTLKKKIQRKLDDKKMKINIVLVDDFPIGYIQSYPVDGQGAWTSKVKVIDNMVSLDYYIGDINFIHKGIGSKMILKYIDDVVKKDNYSGVLISPDPKNLTQEKLMQKCGFKYIKTVNVPYKNSKEKEAVYVKIFE